MRTLNYDEAEEFMRMLDRYVDLKIDKRIVHTGAVADRSDYRYRQQVQAEQDELRLKLLHYLVGARP